MNVFQIFVTDAKGGVLPEFFRRAGESIDSAFPGSTRVVYDRERLRQFIAAHYGREVLWAYDKLRPYSYKADLGRYCLLNTLGGWYFDMPIRVVNSVTVPDDADFLAFRDMQRYSGTCWACATTVLYSRPNNRGLESAIRSRRRELSRRILRLVATLPNGPVGPR